MLTLSELITAQSIDAHCRTVFASVGKPDTRLNDGKEGVLLRFSPFDGASKRDVLACLRLRFVHPCYYFLLASHLGERRMDESMR